MTRTLDTPKARALLEKELQRCGVVPVSLEAKPYPEETIFVVYVSAADFSKSVEAAGAVDEAFSAAEFSGFVTIRRSEADTSRATKSGGARGVSNPKVDSLVDLLTARSRTSEIQPSLEYVRDSSNQLGLILTARNHLIFGRRGAGKTTLMVEAKRQLEAAGHATVWINMQTHRHATPEVAFVWILTSIIERLQTHFDDRIPKVLLEISELKVHVDSLLSRPSVSKSDAVRLIPRAQRIIKRFVSVAGCRLVVFLDDLHYLKRDEQPALLDMVHGITRDIDAWIKVACIKHLSRWFEHSPPTGLQTGHDADHVELDLTLESPAEAKDFLDQLLNVYAKHVGLTSERSVFSDDALNRLLLASGAVPRDYLVLAASAIRLAKRRQSARLTGVQDVNRAAGDQSKVKIAELEDDAAASTEGGAQAIILALNRVREFCLDEKRFSFFKIDFRDKESNPKQYGLVQSLLDVRIVHLIASSLSDKNEAGRRSEVFMLDLSQFSGQRLKKRIHVLDFVDQHIVLRETTTDSAGQKGDTPKRLQDLLRTGPLLELTNIPLPNQGKAPRRGKVS